MRNYKEEYRRRIAAGAARGQSRSQARGHARAGEASITGRTKPSEKRLRQATKHFLKNGHLTKAAKAAGVSAERLRRELYEQRLAERRGRRVVQRIREMQTFSQGREFIVKLGFEAASENGKYLNAVRHFVETNDLKTLEPFRGRSIADLKNKRHPFETNPNTLYRLTNTGGGSFEQVYRLTAVL